MYHYQGCGLPNVWLVNGYELKTTAYGKAVVIHDLDDLHKAIGSTIVNKPGKLTGAEVRYLRKEMDLSQKELALRMEVSEITARKWERNGCGGPAARLLRAIYNEETMGVSSVKELIERISKLNLVRRGKKLRFKDTTKGWLRENRAA